MEEDIKDVHKGEKNQSDISEVIECSRSENGIEEKENEKPDIEKDKSLAPSQKHL